MYRRRQRPSASSVFLHTFLHLLPVVAIFAVAVTLGMLGKSLGIPASGLVAQTSGGVVYPTTTTGGTLQSVTFSVAREAIACTENVTRARYRFSVSPENGGSIAVMTPTGVMYVDNTSGVGFDRYFEAGSYSWQGGARAGYVGTNFGTFFIENICTNTTTASGATTTTTTTSTVAPPPPPPAATTIVSPNPTLVGVSFSAQPGPVASCSATGAPLTPVFLVITKEEGGEFLVTSNTGMNNAHYGFGEYFFPNGIYTWSASVKSGYVGEGTLTGSFTINNKCGEERPEASAPTSTETSTTLTATTNAPQTTPSLPPLPRPQLHLFLNNVPVTLGRIFNKEEVEIRITTAIAEEVEIFTTEGIAYGKLLAEAVKDELLSRPGIDVWSYIADMSTFSEGTTKIHVRVKHSDGRETISERMTVTVKHPSETTRRVLITSAPLPVLTEVGSGTVKTSVSVTASEREAILTRISDPSSCTNAEECKIYCRSLPGVNDLCVAFAQERLAPTLPVDESLADDVSPEDLAELLVGGAKHSMDLPEYISDPAELKQYCAEIENAELCTKVFLDNDLSTRDALERKSESITRSQEERRTVFVERTGTRAYIDTDTDGVTDYDEVNIYNTDPQNGDTDNDGFSDGAELLARTNPSGGVRVVTGFGTSSGPVVEATTDESVVFANPMITGETLPSLLVVKNVEVVGVGTTTEGGMTAKKLKLAGTAGPNSFVTLYIFSEPIVVTVKADGAGAWVYTLDKELPDGTHQVYSAITDAGGRILAKSEPLPFVKSAAAVSLGGAILTPEAAQPGFFTGSSLYAMIAVLIGILGVALSIIGFIVRQKSIADSADLPGL